MPFLISWYALAIFCVVECAVLDPALYLSPSPPMKLSSSAESLWFQSPVVSSTAKITPEVTLYERSNAKREVMLNKARTFWPKIRTDYNLGSIHIPLTFSISGSYGGADAMGAIGTSYASVSGLGSSKIIPSYSKPLAGSSYEILNSGQSVVRIYGGKNRPAWSGWGNGKWGHYGKG